MLLSLLDFRFFSLFYLLVRLGSIYWVDTVSILQSCYHFLFQFLNKLFLLSLVKTTLNNQHIKMKHLLENIVPCPLMSFHTNLRKHFVTIPFISRLPNSYIQMHAPICLSYLLTYVCIFCLLTETFFLDCLFSQQKFAMLETKWIKGWICCYPNLPLKGKTLGSFLIHSDLWYCIFSGKKKK